MYETKESRAAIQLVKAAIDNKMERNMIQSVEFNSVPGIVDTTVEFISGLNVIIGGSGTGKTSLLFPIWPNCMERIDGIRWDGKINIIHDNGCYTRDGFLLVSGEKPEDVFTVRDMVLTPGCECVTQYAGSEPLTSKQKRVAAILKTISSAKEGQTIIIDDLDDGMDSDQMHIVDELMSVTMKIGAQFIVSVRNSLFLNAISGFTGTDKLNVIHSQKGHKPAHGKIKDGIHFIPCGNLEQYADWTEDYSWSEIYEKGVLGT